MYPLQFAYQPSMWWKHHLLSPGQITLTCGKALTHYEDCFFLFFLCFQHHTNYISSGQAGGHGIDHHLSSWILDSLTYLTVCWAQLSAVWMPTENSPVPFHSHAIYRRLLPLLTSLPFVKDICLWQPHNHQSSGREQQSQQITYPGCRGLVPADPPPGQHGKDQSTGGGHLQAQTPLHTVKCRGHSFYHHFYEVVWWRKRLDKLLKKASSIVECLLEVAGERSRMASLWTNSPTPWSS